MDGALNVRQNKWLCLNYFPYEILRKKWQYYLSKMVTDFDQSPETKKLIDELWKKYGHIGFVFNIDTRDVPRRSESLAKYLSKYLFRPAISLKRIIDYDEKKQIVVYEYACHETGKLERAEINVLDFIGRMMQQVLPKGFQRVRYWGLQASSSYKKSKKQIHDALDRGTELIRDNDGEVLVKRAAQLTFREKILKWKKRDPLKCKKCGHEMELVKVWIKGVGPVFDLFEELGTGPPIVDFMKKRVDDLVTVVPFTKAQMDLFAQEVSI